MARVVTALVTFVLVGVSGGALAVAQFDAHPNANGGAADSQYTPAVSSQPSSSSQSPSSTQHFVSATSPSSSTLPFTGENVITALFIAGVLVGSGLLIRHGQRTRRE
jgi:hypothetical protein